MRLLTVKKIYDRLNKKNFGGVLKRPMIKFSRSNDNHGFYAGHYMAFNLVDVKGWKAVTELVYHEMIHQYIDEYLNIKCEDDHGKEFKKQYNKFCFGITGDSDYLFGE